MTTADGRIVLWNRPAEELYGWSEQDVLGRSTMDVLVPLLDGKEQVSRVDRIYSIQRIRK